MPQDGVIENIRVPELIIKFLLHKRERELLRPPSSSSHILSAHVCIQPWWPFNHGTNKTANNLVLSLKSENALDLISKN